MSQHWNHSANLCARVAHTRGLLFLQLDVDRILSRSGYIEQPRALALGKARNEIALKVAPEALGWRQRVSTIQDSDDRTIDGKSTHQAQNKPSVATFRAAHYACVTQG